MPKPRDRRRSAPEPEQPPNTALILGLVFSGFAGFVLLCGGCCFGTMYLRLGTVEQQVRADLANNDVIQEQIGEIQTFELDANVWFLITSRGGEDTYLFFITGDKGSGAVAALVQRAGGAYYVEAGTLVLTPSGESYELIEGKSAGAANPRSTTAEPPPDVNNPADDRFAAKVQKALDGHPVLAEQIGKVQSFSYDYAQSQNEPRENVFVFQIAGSKGNAKLRAEAITVDTQTEQVVAGELTLDDGQRVQLFPDKPLP